MNALEIPWANALDDLPLITPTRPEWFPAAVSDVDALLVDHAHCEQKAASMALSLIGRYPDDAEGVRAMLALVYEELRHFREVLTFIERRGGRLTPPNPDRYVRLLRDWSFRHKGGVGTRADAYLACAFVEARSCERFRILAAGFLAGEAGSLASDEAGELGGFYLQLADAERRHWTLFRDLALATGETAVVERRLQEMAEAESAIVAELPLAPRMH